MLQIVTDSSTLYSIREGEEKGITVCPLHVNIDGKSYRDFEDLTSTKLLKFIQEKKVPSTSQPSIGEKIDTYNRLSEEGEVLDITMAQGLSGTYDNALLAKSQCDHPEKIHILNSKTLCGPHRSLVDRAIKMKEAGASLEEIKTELEKARETDISFLIPFDFQFLLRGGRVRQIEAGLGGLLKLLPVMKRQEDGTVLVKFTVTRTFKKALRSILEEFDKRNVTDAYTFYITHAFNDELAFAAQKMLREKYPEAKIVIYPLSPTFITQGGPGCIAIQTIKI
ncbi:DegV family protein with EDD domain [Faecalicoccus acidiformans]|uniref:DegV family protein with EDD domain n=1 Tax=Faecalicoccus acidiformans TaxID=915173 RepID=A0A7W8FZ13_9FIRM|nr:DegV family protein [Faecalicoccus acidiformans]MBB5185425.1 DegV family protein with EDD domain [Faecalicoccus acidiformans]